MTAVSDIVGFAAGVCTTASFAPQVVKAWRTRSTRDISLGMYLLLALGIALWLIHGLQVASMPIVVANSVTLILVAMMLIMKVRYK